MKKILVFSILLAAFAKAGFAQNEPSLSETDRVRIAEVFRLGDKIGDKIWKGWSGAPWALLLVTPDKEFLIRHSNPSKDFVKIGYDALLKSDVYTRPRKFSPQFLATFPAAGDATPVIVVGQAENTSAKSSTPWVLTVLHEHFHQLQYSQPEYYADVDKLNLSGGDQTGMWMLNYKFPYGQREIAGQFKLLSELLVKTYDSKNESERSKNLNEFSAAREKFKALLKPENYRYLSFQLWQEGIARYTQIRAARFAAGRYKPGREFSRLKDYTDFKKEYADLEKATFDELNRIDLTKSERVAFYPFGAIEGLLLDKTNRNWQKKYFADKFNLDGYFQK